MSDKRYNLVTFRTRSDNGGALGPRIFLQLEGPFTLTAGIEPDVNRALVPWTEFEKLAPAPPCRGVLEFWHSSAPAGDDVAGNPDVKIADVAIVDFEPSRPAEVVSGEETPRITEFRLFLSDVRERWTGQRGGLLMMGEINVETRDVFFHQNDELIGYCLTAMGLGGGAPEAVNDVPPPRNLKWFGSPPAAELSKLLDRCAAVFCPQSDGSIAIRLAGKDDEPTIPADLVSFDLQEAGTDRRGDKVIFTSAPLGTLDTITVPHQASTSGEGTVPDLKIDWRFVTRNSAGYWDTPTLEGVAVPRPLGQADVRNKFKDVPLPFRERVKSEMYRCILLDFTRGKLDQFSPVLRKVLEGKAANQIKDLTVTAAVAYQDPETSLWRNGENVILNVTDLLNAPAGTVLCFDRPLGLVAAAGVTPYTDPAVSDFAANFIALDSSKLKFRLTIEGQKKFNGDGPYSPEFFNVGYQTNAQTGEIERMTQDAVDQELQLPGRDTVFVQRPQLRLLRVDGTAVNEDDAVAQAKSLAPRHLVQGDSPRTIGVKGIYPVELSGRVQQILWDQQALTTTLRLNARWTPSLGLPPAADTATPIGSEAYVRQGETSSEKTAEGSAGAQQPATLLGPSPASSPWSSGDGSNWIVKLLARADAPPYYKAAHAAINFSTAVDVTTAASARITETNPDAFTCYVLDGSEVPGAGPAINWFLDVPGSPLQFKATPWGVAADGKPVFLIEAFQQLCEGGSA